MKTRGLLLLAACLCAVPAGANAGDGKPAGAETPAAWAGDLSPVGEADWNARRAAHLLERAGFGGTPEEVERLARMTPARAVESLLDYEAVDDRHLPTFEPSGIYPNGYKLIPLDQVVFEGILTGKAYGVKATQSGKLKYQPAVNEFYTLLLSEHGEMRRAGQWWAERMLLTPRPLQEKLTLFWHDHFATSQEKVTNYELMLAQNETLRRHAAGNFRDLLIAIARDPAMLVWLDNRDNVKGKPNENFAREVMELFCMGEGRGYTEADIREVARAFTGWTLPSVRTTKDVARFVDDEDLHDGGEKTFLGATGRFTGTDAIDMILKQPATPRFLARKLYRFFVREDLPPELHDKLAKLLLGAKYEIRPFLKAVFLSRDFYSRPSVGTQVKSPTQFLVGTYRKFGLKKVPGYPDYVDTTTALGQLPFYPPNVAGWPGGRAWVNPATLLARGNFAHALLFPDPDRFVAPDKQVADGYRKIPLLFPQYDIVPHVWDPKTRKMEPVSLKEYEAFCARLDGGEAKPAGAGAVEMPARKGTDAAGAGDKGDTSRMMRIANSEDFNLAVGVYTGFIEAARRVKPVPRFPADVDFAALLRAAEVGTVAGAVDHFARRFLSVELSSDRRAAVVAFLRGELGGDGIDFGRKDIDLALRRAAHLVLSAPEYQVN